MKKNLLVCFFACICLSLFAQKNVLVPNHEHEHSNHEHSSISFVKNKNQWDQPIKYRASLGGINTLFLEGLGFTYVFAHPDDAESLHEIFHGVGPERPIRLHAYKVHFKNANDAAFIEQEEQSHYNNYFIGNDPERWAQKVPIFNALTYDDLYDGIDLKAYSAEGHFKYDFIINPGADPESIQMVFEGEDALYLEDGKLIIETSVETIVESAPFAFQMVNGKKERVECNYHLDGQTLSYHFPEGYDFTKALIIDPEVVASTLSGTTDNYNFGHCATFDKQGNIYAGGRSYGTGYPTTIGAYQMAYAGGESDVSVTKYNQEGTAQIYATYLGGGAKDVPHSMVADDNGQLLIFGTSESDDYPVTSNAFQTEKDLGTDIIITKLNTDGSALLGSTYVGGSDIDGVNLSTLNSNYDDHYRGEIILNNQGDVYIASCTTSDNFPVTTNAYDTSFDDSGSLALDAVVFKMNNNLSVMEWATYLGDENADTGFSLRVDDFGKVYVTGIAGSGGFPTTMGTVQPDWPGGDENAYVTILDATGSEIIASTFWGSTGSEHGFFLDLDDDGLVHVYGQTTGEMPITPNTYFYTEGSSQFISAFSEELSEIKYSTVIGTGPFTLNYDFVPVGFMVDKCRNIYFSGYYASGGLPLTSDAISTTGGTFYLGVLDPMATALQFGTYYGAVDHIDGGMSHFDKSGKVYQGVCSCTSSGTLNTLPGAFAEGQTTFCDIGVFKIDFDINVVNAVSKALPAAKGCAPFEVAFNYTGQNATDFFWDFDDGGGSSIEMNPSYTFEAAGTYEVLLVASNQNTCNVIDSSYLMIEVLSTSPILDIATAITDESDDNQGDGSISIENISGGVAPYEYEWSTGATTAVITDLASGTYELTVTDATGCVSDYSFDVGVGTTVEDLKKNLELWLSPGILSVGQSTHLYVKGDYQGTLKYSLIDLNGRQFTAGDILKNEGVANQLINVPSAPGVYFVQVIDELGKVQEVLRVLAY